MPTNGQLTPAELSPIPGGQLANDAARAWNAPGGPADHGLKPGGPLSSYRTLGQQEYLYRLYEEGRGNLAAYPGTSNHGLGLAIDCPNRWEQLWLRAKGAKFSFEKTEAFTEAWHYNFVAGRPAVQLGLGHKGSWVRKYRARLRFLGYRMPRGRRFDLQMKAHVEIFQKRHGLKVDGVIGGSTAYRINEAMRRHGK